MLRYVPPPVRRSLVGSLTTSASDFLLRAPKIDSLERLNREFERHVKPMGFDYFSYVHLAPSSDLRKSGVMFGHSNEDWLDHYIGTGLVRGDPMLRRIREGADPFAWSDLLDTSEGVDFQRVLAEARCFGLDEGYVVPVRACVGDVSAVVLAGPRETPIDRAGRTRLNALGTVYGMCGRSLVELCRDVETAAPLTLRERRCLALFALECNDWEISTELGITMQTVGRHFDGAIGKLGTRGRSEAAAFAARHGWLSGTLAGQGLGELIAV